MESTTFEPRAAQSLVISPQLHPGYHLRRLRGRGSFGQVWEGEDAAGGPVALKFLPFGGNQAVQELRSLQLVRDLSHRGLIRMHKVWSTAGCLVVAMDLADGSLADLLDVYQAEVGAALPRDHVLPLLVQAAEALDFLNNRQHFLNGQWVTVQHCDVTPRNVLVFGNVVKLSDFGLTTALTSREKAHHRAGTPAYAGPEVFQGRVSDRTDQYALAVCYCVLRSGFLPFPHTPASFEPGYIRPAPDLDMLEPAERPAVARALARVPQDRWPSCGELVAELARAGTPPPARPWTERRQAPRHRPDAVVKCEVLQTLGNQSWRAQVQNLSAEGLCLRVHNPGCPLRPGRVLDLALHTVAQDLRLIVQLRLTHSAEQEGGDYEVGGSFDCPLSSAELKALLAQA
jgi:serine/threonine protein kinase, bacterial